MKWKKVIIFNLIEIENIEHSLQLVINQEAVITIFFFFLKK